LSKKPPPVESLITHVSKRLEQISSDTPEDFSQTVYTPQPLSVVTSPQDTTVPSPKTDEPDNTSILSPTVKISIETPPVISTSIAKTKPSSSSKITSTQKKTRSEVKSPPFSATLDILQDAYEPKSPTETNSLYPPSSYYPSSQFRPTQSEGSSSSSWTEKTSTLEQRIKEGQYFGTPPPGITATSSYKDNSFDRSPQRPRTRQLQDTKSSPSKVSVETTKYKRKKKEKTNPFNDDDDTFTNFNNNT